MSEIFQSSLKAVCVLLVAGSCQNMYSCSPSVMAFTVGSFGANLLEFFCRISESGTCVLMFSLLHPMKIEILMFLVQSFLLFEHTNSLLHSDFSSRFHFLPSFASWFSSYIVGCKVWLKESCNGARSAPRNLITDELFFIPRIASLGLNLLMEGI